MRRQHYFKTVCRLNIRLILCRLDYCNSLLYGISDGLLQRLQSVQNAAARLVTGTRRSDHTSVAAAALAASSSASKMWGSCISRSLVLLPRILLTTDPGFSGRDSPSILLDDL